MNDGLTASLNFHGAALNLRAERQRVLASNIANADTPRYAARDFDFSQALQQAQRASPSRSADAVWVSHPRHLVAVGDSSGEVRSALRYRVVEQPSPDGNSVDMDRERANFADNAVRYEAALRFINGNVRTMLSAIKGE
jgi:flagellar basal-body rod protein FlgB